MKTRKKNRKKGGFSLLELLAVVTILGIIAVVVIPRISVTSDEAKKSSHLQNVSELNSAIERYKLIDGGWPSADLNELDNVTYFPDGLPTNPVDNSAYKMDTTKNRVPQ
jgi:prepilin-type N-terminal cleavage/methylation domain-containing protein